ncbi:MAG: hypothetical protein ABIS14_09995 [Sphingomonas sp.]
MKLSVLAVATTAAVAACLTPSAASPPLSSDNPRIFAAGTISSSASDAAISFSWDGREAYFERGNGQTYVIMVSNRVAAGWSTPRVAPFSGHWLDLEPAIFPDGKSLIFISNRPTSASGATLDGYYYGKVQPGKGGNLWRVDRIGGAWGKPYRLPSSANTNNSIYEPSIARNGDLYFQQADAASGVFHLFCAHATGAGYEKPERLDLKAPGNASDMDAAIARDGSYLIFASDREDSENRLYIAFRQGTVWSTPQALGSDVNASHSVGDPRFGPEHDRLYFVSRRVAPPTGDVNRDLRRIGLWNNGLTNIWSTSFDAEAWRPR